MSEFSNVDASATADSLISYLDATDHWLGAIKSYMVAALRIGLPAGGVVVDVGCGLGHDLDRLAGAGLAPIGVDSSRIMLQRAAASRASGAAAVAQADAAALPFGDASVDGCRAERVLQHVVDPSRAVGEMVRIVKPGGMVLAYEPDESTFRIETDHADLADVPARLMTARHPGIGAQLAALFEAHGCVVDDIVTEASRSYSLERMPINVERVVERAIEEGRFDPTAADRWFDEQRARTGAGTFRARYDKVLVVARRAPG